MIVIFSINRAEYLYVQLLWPKTYAEKQFAPHDHLPVGHSMELGLKRPATKSADEILANDGPASKAGRPTSATASSQADLR